MIHWIQLADPWASRIVSNLWQATWQGSLFIAGVWLVCRAFPRIPPKTRYWIWWIASAQLLVRLALPSPIELAILPAAPAALPLTEYVSPSPLLQPMAVSEPRPIAPPSPAGPDVPLSPAIPIVALWLTGATASALAQWVRLHRARTMIRSAEPVTGLAGDLLSELIAELDIRAPRLLSSSTAPCPLLTGWFHPAVVLPSGIFDTLDDQELRMALAHELVHLRRHDLWLGLVPTAARTLMFFHPLAWLCSHEAAAACEEDCDLQAIALSGGSVASYARLLLGTVRSSAPMAALGAAFGFRLLQRRLTMLNRSAISNRPVMRRASIALVALTCLFAVPWSVTAQTVNPTASAKPHFAKHGKHKVAARHPAKAAKHLAAVPPNAAPTMAGPLTAPVAPYALRTGALAPSPARALTGAAPMTPTPTAAVPPSRALVGVTATPAVGSAPMATSVPARVDAPASRLSGTSARSVLAPYVERPGGTPVPTAAVPGSATVPPSPSASADTGYAQAHGNGITAHYRDANLVTVLTAVFDAAGVSYVISPDVNGTVTCSFKDMLLPDVIESLLRGSRSDSAHGEFTYDIQGNVWYVRPKASKSD